MRYLFILLILFCSCRARKVDTQISKSTTKTEKEQSSQVKEKSEVKEVDKSVTKTDVVDKSETFETNSSIVTADSLVFEKGTLKKALGNAKYSKRTNTRKSNNIQSTGSLQADKVTNTNLVRDSVGKTKEKSKIKTKDKDKNTEVKSVSWVSIPLVLAVLGAVIGGIVLWIKLRNKKLEL